MPPQRGTGAHREVQEGRRRGRRRTRLRSRRGRPTGRERRGRQGEDRGDHQQRGPTIERPPPSTRRRKSATLTIFRRPREVSGGDPKRDTRPPTAAGRGRSSSTPRQSPEIYHTTTGLDYGSRPREGPPQTPSPPASTPPPAKGRACLFRNMLLVPEKVLT